MNSIENKYERKGIGDRTKEIITLSIFIAILALTSVILVDAIVYPFSKFVINNVTLYNIIFKYSILGLGLLFFVLYLKQKISYAGKTQNSRSKILIYLLTRPFHYLSLLLIVLIIVSATLALIYILFSKNYFFLYELSSGK